jgi:hypothetical protein
MTGTAQRLEIATIPEAPEIPLVLDDMVDLKGERDIATTGTAVRLVAEDLGA